jgi:copper ion binding protein
MERRANGLLSVALAGIVVLGSVGALGCGPQPRAQEREETPTTPMSIVTVPVEGMSCGSCVASVKRTVKALAGVSSVDVSLAERRARIRYDESEVTPDQIAAAIRALGYKTGPPVREAGP